MIAHAVMIAITRSYFAWISTKFNSIIIYNILYIFIYFSNSVWMSAFSKAYTKMLATGNWKLETGDWKLETLLFN
jgi:hypothetical protein